jgi:hypothetical protein
MRSGHAVSLHDGANLLQHLRERLARHRIAHVLDPQLARRSVVVPGLSAGFGVHQATGQVRYDLACRLGRDVPRTGEVGEPAVGDALHDGCHNQRIHTRLR